VTVAWAWTAAAALIAAVAAEIVLTRRGTFTVRQAAQWIAVYVSLAAVVACNAFALMGLRQLYERAVLERRFAVLDTDGNGVWQPAHGQLLARRLCETFGHAADSAAGRAVATAQ
jgi:hypothetical protein